jgi:hypothetical protein
MVPMADEALAQCRPFSAHMCDSVQTRRCRVRGRSRAFNFLGIFLLGVLRRLAPGVFVRLPQVAVRSLTYRRDQAPPLSFAIMALARYATRRSRFKGYVLVIIQSYSTIRPASQLTGNMPATPKPASSKMEMLWVQ